MESLLQIENLTKSFGDCILFKNITFGVNEGDKIGLIAKNGAGKSTLLKIICDNEAYDNGKVTFRNDIKVGYLEQTPKFDSELSVIEVCMQGIDSSHEDAWEYENRFKQVLTQLKIADLNIKTGKLSGGQLKRVALAKLIIENNELLILDEPTNHLDIEIIEWLEGYLSRNKIAILMVTHDRYFLDKVCNKIIEIDQQYIYTYNGNYNYYLEKRQERIDAQNAETAKARNLLRTELECRLPNAIISYNTYLFISRKNIIEIFKDNFFVIFLRDIDCFKDFRTYVCRFDIQFYTFIMISL